MQYFIQVFHYFMVLCCRSEVFPNVRKTSSFKKTKRPIMLIEHVHELSMELARDIFDLCLSRTCWSLNMTPSASEYVR